MKLSFISLLALSSIGSTLAAPSFFAQHELDSSSRRGREGNSIVDKLREDRRFDRFVEILEKNTNLRDELESGDGKHTLFAPTNQAIENLEDEWKAKGEQQEWKDVVKYHIAKDSDISRDCLHAGALVPTSLRLKSLGDRHQRLRIFRFGETVLINARAVVEGEEMEADNGRIFAVNNVLLPPKDIVEMTNAMVSRVSTTSLALERTGLACELSCEDRERGRRLSLSSSSQHGMTVMAPSNAAWEMLGFANLRYLFSCTGQQTEQRKDASGTKREWCEGADMLKEIMENHIADELAYSTDIMKEGSMTFNTWGDSKIKVCAKQKGENRGDKDRRRRSKGGDEHENINEYNLVVNDGESRIQFNDLVASNGNIHVVDNVIVGSAKLPFDQMGGMNM